MLSGEHLQGFDSTLFFLIVLPYTLPLDGEV